MGCGCAERRRRWLARMKGKSDGRGQAEQPSDAAETARDESGRAERLRLDGAHWTDQGDRWASFDFMRAGEAVIAGRLEGRVATIVRLRADELSRQIGSDWRLIDRATGIVYAVRSVNPDPEGDRAWVDLLAESGVAA